MPKKESNGGGVDADEWDGLDEEMLQALEQELCTVRQRRVSFGASDPAILKNGASAMIGRMVSHAYDWISGRVESGRMVLKSEVAKKVGEKNLSKFFAGQQSMPKYMNVGRAALWFLMTGKKRLDHPVASPVARRIDEYFFRGLIAKTPPKYFGDDRRHSVHLWGTTELINEILWLARSRQGEVCFVSGGPRFCEGNTGADDNEVQKMNSALRACRDAKIPVCLVYLQDQEYRILADLDLSIDVRKLAISKPVSTLATFITPETRYLLLDHPDPNSAALWVMRNGHDNSAAEPAPRAWYGTRAELAAFGSWWKQICDEHAISDLAPSASPQKTGSERKKTS